ncbi:carbohydrate ABC transporter substrate-binding protein (CUT1 family) [Anaerobacterium chartisolvens]|uniref:Carbohydrate ABC transporter substrate-binding protein (CUT1 family) n=1 Tax=Anaerobacterium chartisolvens TaxID=1297424 RepID=A0A369BAA5_9FIRM|nr:extracellular solute-binding protein [Anaerobacterium chartisolvens]RCX17528.1 carbohydrate ABC transporter substrate-binding protein (CUT1 family) [Anaerobacterium chartisolvens]
MTSDGAKEKIVIRFEHNWTEGSPQLPVFKKMLEEFKKENSNITVQEESAPDTQYHQKLKTEISSDTLGDIIMNWGGSEVKGAVKNKQFMELTDIVNEDPSYKNSFVPGILEGNNVTYQDIEGLWGIPINITLTGFYYNKKIFQSAGLQVPETWDDMLNVINKLKETGTIPWALGAQDGWRVEHVYTQLFYKINGVKSIYDLASRKVKYASDVGVEPFKYLEKLRDMGAFGSNPAAVSFQMEQSEFMSGKAAMNFSLATYAKKFTAEDSPIKDDAGYFAFPYFSDKAQYKNDIFAGGGLSFSLNSKLTGAKKDAAVKLLKHITASSGQQQFEDASALIPTTDIQQNTATPAAKLVNEFRATFKSAKNYANDITDPDSLSSMLTKLRDVSTGLMNKQLTAKQAAQEMDSEIANNE